VGTVSQSRRFHMRQMLTVCRTAFQLQNTERLQSNPQPKCNTGKILEMYGDLGQLYPDRTIDCVLTVGSGSISALCNASKTQGSVPDH
jgi:hypothetical protein